MVNDAPMRLLPVPFGHRDTQALVDQVQAEYAVLYGAPDVTPLEDGVFDPPNGAFFLGYLDGVAVAMGGWRLRSDVHPWGLSRAAEVKRMYVAPQARRRGLARAVLAHLEETARQAGADVMVLETGIEQPEAIAMYTAAGYRQIEKFGYYSWSPLSRCYGKRLQPEVSSPPRGR
jgi:ribosomal protein S18 acetylase RimI-like enzyme